MESQTQIIKSSMPPFNNKAFAQSLHECYPLLLLYEYAPVTYTNGIIIQYMSKYAAGFVVLSLFHYMNYPWLIDVIY